MPTTLLTPTQLAERWGMAAVSLATMRSRNLGPPFIRLGNNTVRYRLSDIIAYERSRRYKPEVKPAALVDAGTLKGGSQQRRGEPWSSTP
jgi:hypothetical protein